MHGDRSKGRRLNMKETLATTGVIAALILGAALIPTDQSSIKLAKDKVVDQKEQIIYTKADDNAPAVAVGTYVEYAYISSEKLDSSDLYFDKDRSYSSGKLVKDRNDNVTGVSFSGDKVFRDTDGQVYAVKKATTTPTEWQKFQEVTPLEAILGFILPNKVYATTDTYTSNDTWTAPAGVTSVTVDAWGAGGGGAHGFSHDGSGGGGGAFSEKVGITVVPTTGYTVVVGTGGGENTAGGDSYFINTSTVLAKGGGGGVSYDTPGTGGAAASGVGDTKFSGGNGGTNSSDLCAAGGGGGAGTTANGGNGIGNSCGTFPNNAGGTGGSVGGGNGGTGVATGPGGTGNIKGGGGGGNGAGAGAAGAGARGEIQIIYTAGGGGSTPVTPPAVINFE